MASSQGERPHLTQVHFEQTANTVSQRNIPLEDFLSAFIEEPPHKDIKPGSVRHAFRCQNTGHGRAAVTAKSLG
jgi:hypothetical protein